MAFCASKATV